MNVPNFREELRDQREAIRDRRPTRALVQALLERTELSLWQMSARGAQAIADGEDMEVDRWRALEASLRKRVEGFREFLKRTSP